MPSKRKPRKLARPNELNIEIVGPFTEQDSIKRDVEYDKISDVDFKKNWRRYLYKPAKILINNIEHEIQYNFCTNQFCKWFGLPQKKYTSISSKPSRYRQVGGRVKGEVRIRCMEIDDTSLEKECLDHVSTTYSNWSICGEIRRLITVNSTVVNEPVYRFHNDGCKINKETPLTEPTSFYKRGKSSANSQRYQCKECKKVTNVLPLIHENFNYHQQRNDILIDFTKDILSRVPVKRTCEKLHIGSQTYYNKLELLYQRCLEFLERHETKPLKDKSFDEMFITSDFFIYYLNNIRQKGMRNDDLPKTEDKKFPTYIITSAEVGSGYVFRSDLAYDHIVTPNDIALDTLENMSDHSHPYLRRFDRLADPYTYYPLKPVPLDTQSQDEYEYEKEKFASRTLYVPGSHVKSGYTAIAHFWLLKDLIKADKWNFVSDNDVTLQSAIMRVFNNLIQKAEAHYFVYRYDKNLSVVDAYKQAMKVRNDIADWAKFNVKGKTSLTKRSLLYLNESLQGHDFYEYETINGNRVPVDSVNWIEHPLPPKDQGKTEILCLTDSRGVPTMDLARMILKANGWSVNNFYQLLRRKISVLERPLVTARSADGKSYIYSNYNPRYAQYLVTIMRTFYNFCWEQKIKGMKMTPAMRFGIADRKYDIKDIIYLK